MPEKKIIKSERFTLPADQADGIIELASLGGIASATGWKRAAIVYAMTAPGTNQHDVPVAAATSGRESFKAFARRGIVGLTHPVTVGAYHAAWSAAGEPGITLGVKVNLPTEAFEDVYVSTGGAKDGRTYAKERAEAEVKAEAEVMAREMLRDDPTLVVEVIKASPAVAQAIVADDVLGPDLDVEIERRRFAERIGAKKEKIGPDGVMITRELSETEKTEQEEWIAEKKVRDQEHAYSNTILDMAGVMKAAGEGTWIPNSRDVVGILLIQSFGEAFQSRLAASAPEDDSLGESAVSEDLLDQVNEFLADAITKKEVN